MRHRIGDRVRIVETMHFDGRIGVVRPTSGLVDDPWDYYVLLDSSTTPGDGFSNAQLIGVFESQIERLR